MWRAPYALVVLAAALISVGAVLIVGRDSSSPTSHAGCAVPGRSVDAGPAPEGARAANPAQTAVVCAWASAEARGDYARASALFALPALIETPDAVGRVSIQQLAQPREVESFNRGLTCAAVPIRSVAVDAYTVVSFRLMARPRGSPCQGVAHTAFLVRDGHIAAWLRAPDDLSRLRLPSLRPGGGDRVPPAPPAAPSPPDSGTHRPLV